MAFELVRCKGPEGLPLIEIPDGPYIWERLSPGTIREADFYDNFRRVRRGNAEVLVACPRGQSKGDRCEVPLRVLRIRHKKESLRWLLEECRSGRLAKRRARDIERILKDVHREMGEAPTSAVRIGSTLLAAAVGIGLVIRLLFPDALEGAK